MAYAIMRVKRHSTYGTLGGMSKHNFREIKTENAIEERFVWNTELIDPLPGGERGRYEKNVKLHLENNPNLTYQKTSVKAVEHLLTASPDWFNNIEGLGEMDPRKLPQKSKDTLHSWFQANAEFLRKYYGKHSIITDMSVHFDESTPHIHAFVIPVSESKTRGKKGKPGSGKTVLRVGAKKFLDGRGTLSRMQDEYAKAMEKFGLERGIKNSKAQHQTIKKLYSNINNEVEQARLKPIKFKDFEPIPAYRLNKTALYEERIEQIKKDVNHKIYEQNLKIQEEMDRKAVLKGSEKLQSAKLKRLKEEHKKEIAELKNAFQRDIQKTYGTINDLKSLNEQLSKYNKEALDRNDELEQVAEKQSMMIQKLNKQLEQRLTNLTAREKQLEKALNGTLDPEIANELRQTFAQIENDRRERERREEMEAQRKAAMKNQMKL